MVLLLAVVDEAEAVARMDDAGAVLRGGGERWSWPEGRDDEAHSGHWYDCVAMEDCFPTGDDDGEEEEEDGDGAAAREEDPYLLSHAT